MKPNKIFRKEALDRLATPEQLHTLMQVTNARSWVALLGCGLVLVVAGAWSVGGRIPTKVAASGILLHAGGLTSVVAVSQGQLATLEVEPGEIVRAGQVIARISQPEMQQQIVALEARVADLIAHEAPVDAPGGEAPPGGTGVAESQPLEQAPALVKARQRLDRLREQLVRRERVVAAQDGRVVEVRAAVGDLVAPGVPIVSLERTGERAPLEALLFVDSREGKTLRPASLPGGPCGDGL